MPNFYLVTFATETRVIWPMAGDSLTELAADALRDVAPEGTQPVEIRGPFASGLAKTINVSLSIPERRGG